MSTIPSYAAVVLAGGKSTRLGRDKASEPLLGRTLLQHVVDRVSRVVEEVVVVRSPAQQLPSLLTDAELRVIDDAYPGSGPLGGICTGVAAAAADRCLAVACDMPLLSVPLLAELLRRSDTCDVVMPVREFPEPLHAVYSRACVSPMRERIAAGQYKIISFLSAVRVCYVRRDELRLLDPEDHSFLNTNTEADLRRAEEILGRETGDEPPGRRSAS